MKNVRTILLGTAMLVATFGTSAHAQENVAEEAANDGVGEIIVTAQRRDQNLQDVGVAVSAVGGDDLRRLGIVESRELVKAVPGVLLESTAGGGVNAFLTIRGISQSDYSANQESPNSMYLDEIYLSSPNSAAFTMYDLERVEILRGPQGTLFGRASSGGLASFITAKPTKEFSGHAEFGYASFNNTWADAAVSGPISDAVRFRLSGRTEIADGWFENGLANGKDSQEKSFFGIRGQIEADLSEKFTARVAVSLDKNPKHREGAYRRVAYTTVGGQPVLTPDQPVASTGYVNPYTKFNKSDFNDFGFLKNERFAASLYLSYDLGNASINSITNYTKFKFDYEEDCDGSAVNYCDFGYGQNLDQYSQELRINGTAGDLTYTGGLYYLNIDQIMPQFFRFPLYNGTDFSYNSTNIVKQKQESWAAFGQLEYQLAEKLKATVGVRYTRERKDFDSKVYFIELGNGYSGGTGSSVFDPPLLVDDFSEATVGNLARQSEGLWSGKIQLDYKPNDDTLIYASASRGVKAAGFNTNLSLLVQTPQIPFRSEHLYAYEGGVKLDLLDRKLRVNTSAFYYDYSNFQGFSFITPQSFVGNYDGYFYGGEMEVTAAPSNDLQFSLAASYLKTKLYDVGTVFDGIIDQESIMAPKWTLYGSVTKSFDLSIGKLSAHWNGNYLARRFASIDNNLLNRLPGVFMHSARLTLELEKPDIELGLFINNIGNKAKQSWVQPGSDGVIYAYDRPRWIGGSIRKTF